MSTRAAAAPFIMLDQRPEATTPIFRQLYSGLRQAILSGQLAPGTQLPSTRALASDLSISRTTVVTAFEQLLVEGYVEGRVGSGTYVARALPEGLPRPAPAAATDRPADGRRALSRRGAHLAATPVVLTREEGAPRAFRPGLPALDAFPFETWARLVARRYRQPPRELLAYGEPAGYRPLREAIAGYLAASRGVRCSAEQVVVVAGTPQAIDLTARVLLDPDDDVWVEDPGYLAARVALRGAGARLIPTPVDEQGLNVAAGVARAPAARMVYVTPSHQYPLGVTLSLPRRLALLEWAARAGAWVLEDDYDSEFRFAGRPLASLQGLDSAERVIYLGSFSKTLFPSLCLAYLVAPTDLVDAFIAGRAVASRHMPSLEQAALTDFIVEGHFQRHIRRMRTLYAERQAALVRAAARELAGLLEAPPKEAGLHLIGWLPSGVDDRAAAAAAATHGVEAPPLTPHAIGPIARPGLVLGYAAVDTAAIEEGTRRLGAALRGLPALAR